MDNKTKLELRKRVEALHEIFHQGGIPTLAQHEVNPGLDPSSRLNYIYFTLPVCLNFQRSSPAMWAAALKAFEDKETHYLFYPEKVVATDYKKVQQDLIKHRLGLQLNKHTEIWVKISTALNKLFDSDPREVIKAGEYDVEKILKLIRVIHSEHFPYLRGPKLSNYWLFILDHFTDIELKNKEKLSIIPDTHIIQSTIHLGLTQPTATIPDIEKAWVDLLADSHLNPVDMHSVLWNWSRNSFKPAV